MQAITESDESVATGIKSKLLTPPMTHAAKLNKRKIIQAIKYNVEGFPTIKLLKDGQVIEYDAKPTKETLTQFLNTVL